ncbi:hypothetical protein, partial [Pseudomonas abietaniphila]|uniref:hypothetical protein n=1 Tax=Pseudomonas abietaniphila TaxID=89065 RepID=UPI001EE6CF5D
GPNQEPGTFGYFWCLFKSDPPEGRKGESAPPERMDLLTIPTPYPTNPTNPKNPTSPPTANVKNQKAGTINNKRREHQNQALTDSLDKSDRKPLVNLRFADRFIALSHRAHLSARSP